MEKLAVYQAIKRCPRCSKSLVTIALHTGDERERSGRYGASIHGLYALSRTDLIQRSSSGIDRRPNNAKPPITDSPSAIVSSTSLAEIDLSGMAVRQA
jgi:hypothetical protein